MSSLSVDFVDTNVCKRHKTNDNHAAMHIYALLTHNNDLRLLSEAVFLLALYTVSRLAVNFTRLVNVKKAFVYQLNKFL